MFTGWIAMKYKASFPYLTRDLKINPEKDESSWLKHLSYGGLTTPSVEWLRQAKCLNLVFEEEHKGQLLKGPGIVSKVTKIALENNPDIPHPIANAFIKQRTFIRMKFLNECAASKKRKNSFEDENRKKANKYKKIIS